MAQYRPGTRSYFQRIQHNSPVYVIITRCGQPAPGYELLKAVPRQAVRKIGAQLHPWVNPAANENC